MPGLMWRALRWSLVAVALWAAPAGADWSAPGVVERARGDFLRLPELAVGPSGALAAAWASQDRNNQQWVRVSYRPPGGRWTPPRTISGPLWSVETIALALDGGDRLTVVWQALSSPQTRRVQAVSGPWEEPVTLSDGGSGPVVAVDDEGVVTVMFTDGGRIQVASRPPDGGWSAAETFSASGRSPRLVNRPGRGLTAVWWEGSALRSSDLGDGWSAPATISATAGEADLRVNADGDLLAAWHGPGGVQAALRPAGADWGAPATLAAIPQADSVHAALNTRGEAVVAWTSGFRAHGAYRLPTGAWTPAEPVSPAADVRRVKVVVDAGGTATALLTGLDAEGIRRTTRSPAGVWASPVALTRPWSYDQRSTAVATDSGGAAHLAWLSGDATVEHAGDRLLWATTGAANLSETEILSGPADGSFTSASEVTFTFNGGSDSHACTGPGGWCRSPHTMWLPRDGAHTFGVAVGDDATGVSRTIHRDTVPPRITGFKVDGEYRNRFAFGERALVTLEVTDDGAGVHSFDAPRALDTSTPGWRTHVGRARDNVGNEGEAQFGYYVDPPPVDPPPPPVAGDPAPFEEPEEEDDPNQPWEDLTDDDEPDPLEEAEQHARATMPKRLSGPRPTIAALLRRGVVLRYRATTTGRLALTWRLGRAVVARGARTIKRPGTFTLRLRATGAGRKRLARRTSVRVGETTVFRTGGASATNKASLTLKRGRS